MTGQRFQNKVVVARVLPLIQVTVLFRQVKGQITEQFNHSNKIYLYKTSFNLEGQYLIYYQLIQVCFSLSKLSFAYSNRNQSTEIHALRALCLQFRIFA